MSLFAGRLTLNEVDYVLRVIFDLLFGDSQKVDIPPCPSTLRQMRQKLMDFEFIRAAMVCQNVAACS